MRRSRRLAGSRRSRSDDAALAEASRALRMMRAQAWRAYRRAGFPFGRTDRGCNFWYQFNFLEGQRAYTTAN